MNVPELLPKYKSISRYVRLSYRLRQAYDIYPPAALSLLHPDLPLPKRNMPFLTNHCRKVFRDFLAEVPPTYVAYEAVVACAARVVPQRAMQAIRKREALLAWALKNGDKDEVKRIRTELDELFRRHSDALPRRAGDGVGGDLV